MSVVNPVGEVLMQRVSGMLMPFHDKMSVVNPVGEALREYYCYYIIAFIVAKFYFCFFCS